MLVTAAPHFMVPRAVQRQIIFQTERVKRHGMPLIHLLFNILHGDTTDAAYRIGKIFIDNVLVNTNGFKNLRALIRLDSADAHLGGDFDDAVQNGIVVVVNRSIIVLIQHMIVNQLLDGLLRQIRVDGTGAIP